jgi:hypothetical protein
MNVELGPTGLIRQIAATGTPAVRAGSDVLIAHIQSQTKLKFGLYGLASVFVVASALLVVFAPENREATSSIVAAALFVVAVGCAGFGTFAIKTPLVSAQAGAELAQPAAKQAPPVAPAAAAPVPVAAAPRAAGLGSPVPSPHDTGDEPTRCYARPPESGPHRPIKAPAPVAARAPIAKPSAPARAHAPGAKGPPLEASLASMATPEHWATMNAPRGATPTKMADES